MTTRQKNNSRKSQTGSALRKLAPANVGLPSALRRFSAEEVQRLRHRITEPLECVFDQSFYRPNAARKYGGIHDELVPQVTRDARARSLGSERGRGGSLPQAKEVELFLTYNYFRYRMMRILKDYEGRRLTVTAARELLELDEAASRTCDAIVEANLGLVPSMVQRARLRGIDFGELISEGHLALLRSVSKFDCSRGFKFSTYACRAIMTSITRAVALMARHRAQFPTEFDPKLQRGDTTETRRAGVEEDCIEALQDALRSNEAELTVTEREVLAERFGMSREAEAGGGGQQKTLRQVAETFGVTKERVRQIQNKALAKLREVIDERVFAA